MRTGISFAVTATDTSPSGGDRRPQRAAESRLAGPDRASRRRGGGHERRQACGGRLQDGGPPLAGALHAGVRGRAVARQDAPVRTPPAAADRIGEAVRLTQGEPPHEAAHWTARAMASACGRAVSTVLEIGKKHGLGRIAGAASSSHRPRLRPQPARRGRPLRRSAGPRHRAVGRREEPDPGPRPHPTRPCDEEGPGGDARAIASAMARLR